MAHSRIIPPVDQCIAYIESCGWKLETRESRWYRFTRANGQQGTPNPNFVSFTTAELRHAFLNGW